ncbi:MAG: PIG-L deacetylase family protein [Actinomycetota bacterium]
MSRGAWRALVVSAHPDDVEFAAAGTLARWVDQGAELTICVATDGSTGTQDRALMGEPLSHIRKVETERAAEIIGAREVVWLGYRDGYVEYTMDLKRDIARIFRRYRPHRFMVMDPTPTIEDTFINHPDHRAIGQASLDVSMTSGTTPGIFGELLEEGLEPWRGLRELWIMGPGLSPVLSDISSTIERKIEALLCHASQVGERPDEIAMWVREWTAEVGATGGRDHAESFRVISQGPGFHAGEQDEVEFDLPDAPLDPRSAPPRERP